MADSPLVLWLTDRSRYSTGLGRCAAQRYLSYHFGPTGYGVVRRADSLPLATGQYTHLALERIFGYLRDKDQMPPVEAVREYIAEATAAYEKRIESRGFRGLLQSEKSDEVLVEQQTLLEGLIWTAVRGVIPWMHQTYRIVEAETESVYMLGCTCGLGSAVLDPRLHAARTCAGIGMMLRQDVLAEHRTSHNLAYFEGKTTGWAGDNWAPQWETRPQLAIGTFGVKERFGREVTEHYILALYKGSRRASGEGEDQVVRQDSATCYGYCRPGNPPLSADDWLPTYTWTDEDGQSRRASRQHRKRGVWELDQSDWPALAERVAGETAVEFWTRTLPPSVVEKIAFLVGPLNRQDSQIESLKRSIAAEERRWQGILWELYQLQSDGWFWPSDKFQEAFDRLVPRSWDCRRFGAKHECEFKPICFRESGWENPLAASQFVPRRPHHDPELAQAVSRGLLPEQSEEEEGDDE